MSDQDNTKPAPVQAAKKPKKFFVSLAGTSHRNAYSVYDKTCGQIQIHKGKTVELDAKQLAFLKSHLDKESHLQIGSKDLLIGPAEK